MPNQIKIRRGLKANLPALAVGELGFATDTGELYIGTASGNVKLAPSEGSGGGMVLLYNRETDTSETTNTTSETTLRSQLVYNVENYTNILIEATVQARLEANTNASCLFTWRIKRKLSDNSWITLRVFYDRIICSSTSGIGTGGRHNTYLSLVTVGYDDIGEGVTTTGAIAISGQMSLANANAGILLKNFRVWGIP